MTQNHTTQEPTPEWLRFAKMHGCGNDYIFVDCLSQSVPDPSRLAREISCQHFGIGSDGLILICPSDVADFRMRMFNADGSEGEMCGNGIRCFGKYVYEHGLTHRTSVSIETLAGIKTLTLDIQGGVVESVLVDMGIPAWKPVPGGNDPVNIPVTSAGRVFNCTCISMGNPHAVILVNDTETFPVAKFGPLIERHTLFPARTNVEFIQILNENEIKMRVWERGSGETLACGTGACASAVACFLNGMTKRNVTVHLAGGDLQVKYDKASGHVWLEGPAATICEGVYYTGRECHAGEGGTPCC